MKNREEAVKYLQQKGYFAVSYDWTWGPTIAVCTAKIPVEGGMTKHENPFYIYQTQSGWHLDVLIQRHLAPLVEAGPGTLDQIVSRVTDFFKTRPELWG